VLIVLNLFSELQEAIVARPIKVMTALKTIDKVGKQISVSKDEMKSQENSFNRVFGVLPLSP
jgi:hypothetical protein